ncbi:MAG: hypothetical protein R3C03_21995 [Pirellulaceae bacterium]
MPAKPEHLSPEELKERFEKHIVQVIVNRDVDPMRLPLVSYYYKLEPTDLDTSANESRWHGQFLSDRKSVSPC